MYISQQKKNNVFKWHKLLEESRLEKQYGGILILFISEILKLFIRKDFWKII